MSIERKLDRLQWSVGILSVIMVSGFGLTIKYLIDVLSVVKP